MNLHTLKNRPGAIRSKKRVGAGESSGHGKTSGRGHKGQYGRSGHKFKAVFEGGQMQLIRRIPKRGFTQAMKVIYTAVNLDQLQRFEAGSTVTPDTFAQAGLASGKKARIKVLGGGQIDRALQVKAHAFSASAKSKIEAAGGSCEVLA
ncbi:MAG: 50S ribosomal protein L15 [Kiritimatiellae bacterium]|nr:50S ribosomal protein L15 [Kiritimatiellia bacterium]MCO5060922.1 50S ribosomal protein L15 [Kiritimatiellia bacterium]MCO5068163.1 50S ribosomal protein L15 [Kiritimatiellia bacterium]MCO6400817.1 50S ribosomal protein L15 [Verrucomicrobiota bacterium]